MTVPLYGEKPQRMGAIKRAQQQDSFSRITHHKRSPTPLMSEVKQVLLCRTRKKPSASFMRFIDATCGRFMLVRVNAGARGCTSVDSNSIDR